jgi:hypothetical protein
LSGGLVWSDEIPKEEIGDQLMFRYLVKWRTDMIQQAVHPDVLQYWKAAKTAFPNWPGFLPERCEPNPELVAALHMLAGRAVSSIQGALSSGPETSDDAV